jgi:hypothetical protein
MDSEGLVHEWWENFYAIASKGDNIPIMGMLVIVGFFLAWGFREGIRNDRLIKAGKRDQVLKDMQR